MDSVILQKEERIPVPPAVHHSLHDGIAEDVIQALGTGTGFHWCGEDEGKIGFWQRGAGFSYEDTSLIYGADGTTTYMQVTATYTPAHPTVIDTIYLYGSKSSRTLTQLWSSEEVNQSLVAGQDYTIYWTLHADI
jgi:hypothetical protein